MSYDFAKTLTPSRLRIQRFFPFSSTQTLSLVYNGFLISLLVYVWPTVFRPIAVLGFVLLAFESIILVVLLFSPSIFPSGATKSMIPLVIREFYASDESRFPRTKLKTVRIAFFLALSIGYLLVAGACVTASYEMRPGEPITDLRFAVLSFLALAITCSIFAEREEPILEALIMLRRETLLDSLEVEDTLRAFRLTLSGSPYAAKIFLAINRGLLAINSATTEASDALRKLNSHTSLAPQSIDPERERYQKLLADLSTRHESFKHTVSHVEQVLTLQIILDHKIASAFKPWRERLMQGMAELDTKLILLTNAVKDPVVTNRKGE